MRYLFLIYIAFQVIYDELIPESSNSTIIWYAFNFGFLAAVALREAINGNNYIYFYVIAITLAVTAICILSNYNQEETAQTISHQPPQITLFSFAVLIILLIFTIKWNGLKTIFGKRFS